MITTALVIGLGYLMGAVSSSLLVGRAHGIDIRRHGSGNAGLTNVVRVLGWKSGLVVAVADAGKGYLAVLLLSRIRVDSPPWDPATLALIAGFSALVGHVWPAYSGFRGGKGVATAAGALFAIEPLAAVICLAFFFASVGLTGYVSLGSIVAVGLSPLAVVGAQLLGGGPEAAPVVFCVSSAAIIIFAHRSNIARIRAGAEPRIGG